MVKLLQFLLNHGKEAGCKPDNEGNLPLHIACKNCFSDKTITMVFNAYPEAIWSINRDRETPLDIAERRIEEEPDDDLEINASFLESQLRLAHQARQVLELDGNGQLPIHRALNSHDATLGAIKLMIAANPNSINVPDNAGRIPLHFSSRNANVDIVKFLIETNKASLSDSDWKGNFALHHACLGRNYDVVSFILKETTKGASLKIYMESCQSRFCYTRLVAASIFSTSAGIIATARNILRLCIIYFVLTQMLC